MLDAPPGLASSASPTRCSSPPTSSSARCAGPPAVVRGRSTVDRPEIDRATPGTAASFARGRALADARLHGAAPAPYRALDLIALAKDRRPSTTGIAGRGRGAGRPRHERGAARRAVRLRPGAAAGQAAGRRAGRVAGPPGHQGRRRRRRADGEPARRCSSPSGSRCRWCSPISTRPGSTRAVGYVHGEIDKLLAQGPRSTRARRPSCAAWSPARVDKAAFADADLVIEAVFEDLEVKQQVFAELEKVVTPECVLATNTSSLSVTAMAADLQHPERVVGLPLLQPGRGDAAAGDRPRASTPTTPRWPPRSRSARRCRSPACWSRTRRRSWSTGC